MKQLPRSKAFTGVTPFVATTRGLVACADHHADWWVPVINGKPIKAGGKVLRYTHKSQALESLRVALARRTGPPGHNYKLGKRMEQPK